jgi:hypothetical protein
VLSYQNDPPTNIDQNLTKQFIEFTNCNDRFSLDKLEVKVNKYKPLIENIAARGWEIDLLIVITAGARAATHIPSMRLLEDKFKLPMPSIQKTFENINAIAIHYAMSILFHKRRLENHQPLPQMQVPLVEPKSYLQKAFGSGFFLLMVTCDYSVYSRKGEVVLYFYSYVMWT